MNLDHNEGFNDKAREGWINQTWHLTLSGEEHKAQLEHLFSWELRPQMAALSPGVTRPLLPSPCCSLPSEDQELHGVGVKLEYVLVQISARGTDHWRWSQELMCVEQSTSLCLQGRVPCHRHKNEGQFHNIPRSCPSKLGRVFLSLPSVSDSGFPLVTSLFSSESRNFLQTQNKQKSWKKNRTDDAIKWKEEQSSILQLK